MKTYHEVFPVDQMSKTLGVSRSGYYDYLKRGLSVRDFENKKLVDQMKVIFEESQRTYGSPRLQAALKDQGFACSRPRVARLMKAHHIEAKMYKRFKKTTKRSDKGRNRPDLLQQNFQVDHPNRVWVADISVP